jgi:glycine/D-amino acid oxidase-like deaminating enzyme
MITPIMALKDEDRIGTVVIGAGNIGIAAAYYLATRHGVGNIVLVDPRDPMSLTSAQSGENYRNWWPHPVMTQFTDHSIGLMEEIASAGGNRINMTRRGYALVSRQTGPTELLDELHAGYGADADRLIRVHAESTAPSYRPASADWDTAPGGVDVLMDRRLIGAHFPSFAPDIAVVLHIRRAGSISGQQLGQFMLEAIRAAGGQVRRAKLIAVEGTAPFVLRLEEEGGLKTLRADRVINAAGPFFKDVAGMLGEQLPVSCVFQQKIAFEDRAGAIPRTMPFSIDLDGQKIAWTDEERAILEQEPEAAKLLVDLPGGIHCRPDGAENGKWIKLGWAYNATPSDPHVDDPIDPQFPDTVLRGASRLNPSLAAYIGRLPRNARHYGGYYTMTDENWPLIGPMKTAGAFMAGALSGYGTMSACATGALCAAWATDSAVPAYAIGLGLDRYGDATLMAQLTGGTRKRIL